MLVAEHEDRPVGFLFGVGDMNQASRGEPIDTLVVKSLAILPDRRYAGLGTVLLDRCQQAAHRLGFRRAIHALMREGNDRVMRLSSPKLTVHSSSQARLLCSSTWLCANSVHASGSSPQAR